MPGNLHCARPGCSGGVTSWLTYDYAARTVWLDDRDSEGRGSRLGLCAGHGDRLRVPLGWICRDRRAARPAGPPAGAVVGRLVVHAGTGGPDGGSSAAAVAV